MPAGVYVTVTLGSVFRAVLTVARTGFIWLFDVALFYSPLGQHCLGEPFDPMASTVQLIGFGLGIFGTLIYAYGSSRCEHGVARSPLPSVRRTGRLCRLSSKECGCVVSNGLRMQLFPDQTNLQCSVTCTYCACGSAHPSRGRRCAYAGASREQAVWACMAAERLGTRALLREVIYNFRTQNNAFLVCVACRVVMAQQALLLARTTTSTHMGRAIVQDVYFPGGSYSSRLRSLESFERLRRAMHEVRQRSWWSAFRARTSWLLHPTEVSFAYLPERQRGAHLHS